MIIINTHITNPTPSQKKNVTNPPYFLILNYIKLYYICSTQHTLTYIAIHTNNIIGNKK